MGDTIVVGIGNQFRGDDAAGWAVIDGLEGPLGHVIKLVKLRGNIAELIDIFAHHKTVFLVDACQMPGPIGTWQRIDAHTQSIIEDIHLTSTHGFGISQAISLAKILGQIPTKLILYVINGSSYTMSDTISSSVRTGVDAVIKVILSEENIQSCMNTLS